MTLQIKIKELKSLISKAEKMQLLDNSLSNTLEFHVILATEEHNESDYHARL